MPVFRPAGSLPQDILDDIVQRIVAIAAPEQIIMFGSAARGTMGPNSDVDLLVVKGGEYNKLHAAQDVYRALRGVPVAVDVIVVTPEDVQRYRDVHHRVIKPAVREGKIVYAA